MSTTSRSDDTPPGGADRNTAPVVMVKESLVAIDGSETPVDRAGGEPARDGEVLYFRAPGGGGYGDPLDRNMDWLQHDIDNEYVSVESAEMHYGAVVDLKTCRIDRAATEVRRKKLKAEWKRDELFIDQQTKPFAKRPFRVIRLDEEIR